MQIRSLQTDSIMKLLLIGGEQGGAEHTESMGPETMTKAVDAKTFNSPNLAPTTKCRIEGPCTGAVDGVQKDQAGNPDHWSGVCSECVCGEISGWGPLNECRIPHTKKVSNAHCSGGTDIESTPPSA